MARFADILEDDHSNPLAGSIYVRDLTSNLAPITLDGGAPAANPIIVGASGSFYFNEADGLYVLEAHAGGKIIFKLVTVGTGATMFRGTDGINGAIGSSAGFAALFSAAAGMTVGVGITAIRTAGYASATDGGAALYVYDAAVNSAYVTAHPHSSFLAADGRGFRIDTNQRLTIEMFGGKADAILNGGQTAFISYTDNLAPLLEAIAVASFAGQNTTVQGAPVTFGIGAYGFSAQVDLKRTSIIRGQCTGADNFVNGTQLWFPQNSHGIVINTAVTLGDTTVAATTSAAGTTLDGLGIFSLGGTDRTKHGIRMRARANVTNCYVQGFPGDGINIRGQSGAGGAIEGNCNSWFLSNNTIRSGGYGLRVDDKDANAGKAFGTQIRTCGLGAILSTNGLGNSFFGVQVDECATAADAGYVTFNGVVWMLTSTAAGAGGATTPGTDDTIWYPYDSWPGHPLAPAWVSGATYTYAAAVGSKGGTAVTDIFRGCYFETYLGDLGGSGSTASGGTSVWTRDSANDSYGWRGRASNTGYGFFTAVPSTDPGYTGNPFSSNRRGGVGGDWRNKVILYFGRAIDSIVDHDGALRFSGRDVVMDFGNGADGLWGTFNGPYTNMKFGGPIGVRFGVSFPGFALTDPADPTNARRFQMGTGAPTSGTYARGHRIYVPSPTSGGVDHYVGTTGGSITTTAWTNTTTYFSYGNLVLLGGNVYINVNAPARIANHAYSLGDMFSNNGVDYKVTTAGTTSATGFGPAGFEAHFTDGTCIVQPMTGFTTAGSGGPTGTDAVNAVRDGDVWWLYQAAFSFAPVGIVGGVQATHVANGVNAAAAPTQAEFNALVTQFNAALAALQTAKLMA